MMIRIIKNTSISMLLLIPIPILRLVNNWYWIPENNVYLYKKFNVIIKIVTSTWSLSIISTFILIWLIWCLKYNIKEISKFIVIIIMMIIVGQGIKIIIKNVVREYRPYIVWLNAHHNLYHQEKIKNISYKIYHELFIHKSTYLKSIPIWLKNYWWYNKDFSFPSGHAILSTSLALISINLLWSSKHFFSIIIITIWTNIVIITRMILGVHWPKDLLIGIMIGWVIAIFSCFLIELLVKRTY